jgi:opacity protein-like surface antigen
MKYKRYVLCGLVAILMLGISSVAVQAQEARWGVGAFADYSKPYLGLADRWSSTGKFGGMIQYATSTATTIEVEYHYMKMNDGKPASLPFTYVTTGEEVENVDGKSEITFNSIVVNALVFPGDENSQRGYKANDFRFFVLVGGGIYRYKAVNENLIYPNQTTLPIDMDNVMDAQIDERYAYGMNIGAGVEAFVTPNIALDLRVRTNMIIGELRPLLYYDLEKVRPLSTLDVGAGIKFYFWR